MSKKIKIAIAGGSGYTAGELLRILLFHPQVEIAHVISVSQPGAAVSSVHRDLTGDCDLHFDKGEDLHHTDVLFLCLGHGRSREFLSNHELDAQTAVIDLSSDFRLTPDNCFGNRRFLYGLPEAMDEDHYGKLLREYGNVANPGCFATCIQLALLPLASAKRLRDEIHCHAVTGATGAGASLSASSHFAWRSNNLSAYKVFRHPHLNEIRQNLARWNNAGRSEAFPPLNFVPLRGDFTRGIFVSLYTRCSLSGDEIYNLYADYYRHAPFVCLSQEDISLKEAINTNKCFLHVEKQGPYVYINSVIDNLVKGASGQAVQNMNLLFGLDARTGLHLKPVCF